MKPKTGTWNREGRANPREILYIYLAKDPRTAMAEVRPWIGAKISIGEFQLTKEVRLVNCSKYHDSMRQILQDSQANYVDGAWLAIDRAFAKPVTREDDDIANYIPTQIIAEAFRTQGYDGVLYKSLLEESGYNVALFDVDAVRLTSCALRTVTGICFSYGEEQNRYYLNEA